jgi:hypothetical protein
MGISGRTCFRLTTLGALALAGEEGPLAGAACDERSGYAVFISGEMFRDLQDDPRFGALLQRVGLV